MNPPLRPRDDVEALWEYVLDGTVDWVVSDHACCRDELKFGEPKPAGTERLTGDAGARRTLRGVRLRRPWRWRRTAGAAAAP